MADDDDAYPKPGEIRRLSERPAFQQKNDEDDKPSRENVPKLSEHPAYQQEEPDIAKIGTN